MLIVDDEPSIGGALRRLLAADHEVSVVQSGTAALAAFRAGSTFDVVLCDVMMPGLNGIELYDATREAFPRQHERFIFMTGGIFAEPASSFFASIPNPVLEKPFSFGAVRGMLAGFVESQERARSA